MGATLFLEHGELARTDAAAHEPMRMRDDAPAAPTAFEPTLLDFYRADPFALRLRIEHAARRQRPEAIRAFFARIFP